MPSNKNTRGKLTAELKVMERLAHAEQFLARLKADFESCGFRRNKLVEDGIADGMAQIDLAVEHLSNEEIEDADRACRVAWLAAHFVRGIFDAEMTEHYLGEGVFLDLDVDIPDWRKFAAEEMARLQEEIVLFRKQLKKKS
jgi:hypothetical protein